MKSFAVVLLTGVSAFALSSVAQAADLIVDGPGPIQYADTSAHDWDGAYVGVFGGYAWGNTNFIDAPDDFLEPEGWLLGVNAGVNFTLTDGVVAGVVGDLAWSNMNDFAAIFPVTAESTIDWVGSVRGRVGFEVGSVLPYLTAGVAFAHNTLEFTSPGPNGSDDQIHVGWTAGAGVQVAVADNVSVDLLYRYSDYGAATYTIDATPVDFSLTSHQITAGVNVGF